jgi:hypothetical protein
LKPPAFAGRHSFSIIQPQGGGYRGEVLTVSSEIISATGYIWGGGCVWSKNMANRPTNLADRLSNSREPDQGFTRKTFTLPVEAARFKAREILSQFPQSGSITIVEHWRQLPDGQIEFTMRRLRTAD